MYLFGGYDNDVGFSADLYEYDITKYNWRLISPTKPTASPAPTTTAGTPALPSWKPAPRHSHFAGIFSVKSKGKKTEKTKAKEKLVVFGGRGAGNTVFKDIWVFDFETNTWEEIQVEGRT
jgi:N-acetylneuraminic acid mutarotase